MASRIVDNQRVAFVSRAQSTARRLTDDLMALSPAQRAAVLAIVAKESSTPLDFVWLAENHTDEHEIAAILDGTLPRCSGERYSWIVATNAHFAVVALPPHAEITE
jgi:hypothetical protein